MLDLTGETPYINVTTTDLNFDQNGIGIVSFLIFLFFSFQFFRLSYYFLVVILFNFCPEIYVQCTNTVSSATLYIPCSLHWSFPLFLLFFGALLSSPYSSLVFSFLPFIPSRSSSFLHLSLFDFIKFCLIPAQDIANAVAQNFVSLFTAAVAVLPTLPILL